VDKINKLKKALHARTNKEIGERTFDYVYDAEVKK
jgi:hypothetical protein